MACSKEYFIKNKVTDLFFWEKKCSKNEKKFYSRKNVLIKRNFVTTD